MWEKNPPDVSGRSISSDAKSCISHNQLFILFIIKHNFKGFFTDGADNTKSINNKAIIT